MEVQTLVKIEEQKKCHVSKRSRKSVISQRGAEKVSYLKVKLFIN